MNSTQLKSFLATLTKEVFVIDASISKTDYTPIDLSQDNSRRYRIEH